MLLTTAVVKTTKNTILHRNDSIYSDCMHSGPIYSHRKVKVHVRQGNKRYPPSRLFRTPDQNRKTLSGGRMPAEINSLILIHTIKYTPTLLKLKYVCAEKFYSKTDTFQTQFR